MDRAGLRRKLLKAQAEAGDIVLLFGDESEALTHPYLAHVWAKKGPTCAFQRRAKPPKWRCSACSTGPRASSSFRPAAPNEARLHRSPGGDRPPLWSQARRALKPIVLVLDNGPIHTSKATRAALAERAHWLTVEWLPKYAPELNDIEDLWRDLKRHHLAHQTFTGPEDLDQPSTRPS